MEFDKEIVCTDRNGKQHHFKYSIEQSDEEGFVKWIFKVLPFDLDVPMDKQALLGGEHLDMPYATSSGPALALSADKKSIEGIAP